ncbi:MAG TPA: cupin domain-containing protein [Terracidiphilus sp.]|nr:cupin domain-containing protein [Terracidiphilus sp.]
MKRRSFLRTAASIIPAAGLHDFIAMQAAAQSPSAPSQDSVQVVGAGEDRDGHTHTLGFSSIAFKVSASETGGALFIIEHSHLTAGGPALHMHLYQEEWFYVMEGKVAFLVGEQRVELGPGESVYAPRRVRHTFAAISATPSRMLIAFCPAGKMEQFFRDSATAKPDADMTEVFRHYDMRFLGPNPLLKS